MRSVVVFGASPGDCLPAGSGERVTVDGVTVRCGLAELREPAFDPSSPEHAHHVLLRVRGVSCNYRDRGFIHQMKRVPPSRFTAIGSEFVGEVVAVGAEVRGLRPGDRVIPDHDYTGGATTPDGVREGIATNQASRGRHVLHQRKLVRIPDSMPDEVGALFALGAQTAYSIVRRLEVRPGDRVLVTAAGSNTSLFVLAALRGTGARVFAATTSAAIRPRLREMGVEEVIVLERSTSGAGGAGLADLAREIDGFHAVVDPFFDLHLAAAVEVLRPFGRYVTCGFAGQTPRSAREVGGRQPLDARPVLTAAIGKNLTLMGNCLGRRDDLERAIGDFAAGRLAPVLDSVFTGARVGPFLDRTFNDRQRFGKVVYRYD